MNLHYKNRYDNFIKSRALRIIPYDAYTEKHHIIPTSMGGTNDKCNIITLTAREHFIVHYMLAKAYGESMYYAFWMMCTDIRSGKTYRYTNSYFYEKCRQRISKEMKKRMTGRVYVFDIINNEMVWISSKDFKDEKTRYIHPIKGTAIYLINGEHKRLSTKDPRVLSGAAISVRVGYKHLQETKDKMSKNGIKNKILISNTETREKKYINRNDCVEFPWIVGELDEVKEEMKHIRKMTFSKCKWITNGIDNKRVYVYSDTDIPQGWHIGRTLEQKLCPYCGRKVDIGNYAKSHGENCKWKNC